MSKRELTGRVILNRWLCLMAILPSLAWASDLVILEGVGGDEIAWNINEAGVIVGTSYDDYADPVRWMDGVIDVLDGPIVLADGTRCTLDWGDARNVTNSGDVIAHVWSWCDGLDVSRAAIWDDDSRTWEALPMPTGATWTFSPIANAAGHILVNSDVGWMLYKGNKIKPVNIPDDCHAWAMNTKGMIGGYCDEDAVLWHKGEQTILPSLGGNSSYVRGMNDKGTLVGFSGEELDWPYYSSPGSAVSWPDSDTIVDIEYPGWATAINNRGTIVGATGINGDDIVNPFRPVSWDKHGNGPIYLAPGQEGIARSINDSGVIVGQVLIGDSSEAFIYFP